MPSSAVNATVVTGSVSTSDPSSIVSTGGAVSTLNARASDSPATVTSTTCGPSASSGVVHGEVQAVAGAPSRAQVAAPLALHVNVGASWFVGPPGPPVMRVPSAVAAPVQVSATAEASTGRTAAAGRRRDRRRITTGLLGTG
ncbi:MAG: hypothetical protein PGN13_15380 [Patulibacter minatonensis]